MVEMLEYTFFQRAIMASLLASIACGIIGTFVVVKRMASISGGLSHAAFGGVGLGYFMGFSPMLGAVGFGIVCGLGIGWVYLHFRQSLDTLVAIVWSVGMALGVLLISFSPGYAPDLNAYLFGSVLFVTDSYLWWVAGLDVALLLVVWILFKHLQAISFDEEFCEVSGVHFRMLFLLLMLLTSCAVVTLMRVVGAIMLISLLTIPAVVARRWCDSLRAMMIYAIGMSGLCALFGLFLSVWLSQTFSIEAPSGPLVILSCAGLYILSLVTGILGFRGRSAQDA